MAPAQNLRQLPRALRVRFGASGVVGMVSGLVLLAGGWFGAARVLVHQCVAIDGPLADFGQQLTLLHDVPDCPAGTLAMVPGLPQILVLVAALALPVVAAHAAVGALGVGLIAWVQRAARAALGIMAAVLPDLSSLSQIRLRVHTRISAPVSPHYPTLSSGVPGDRHPLRGPPPVMA